MGRVRDFFFGPQGNTADYVGTSQELREESWEEVLKSYDVVEVVADRENPYVIVAARETKQLADVATNVNIGEIGSSSPSPWLSFSRKEYNRDLQGTKGLQTYDRMRKSDGIVRGTLRVVKTPVLAARWFVEPKSDKKRDENAAEFVWKCLTEYMSISWPQVLTEALLCADFGYYMFEKVWEERVIEGQKRMVLAKLAPRHPMDVKEWKYDSHGGPAGVVMYGTEISGPIAEVYIPIDKLLVFTFDREAGNVEGISVLRSAYKHWYFKEQLYKIDAIQKERHGIGIPVIKLPSNFNAEDKVAANDLGRNLRTNERAHVVLPPNWELIFAKMEGHMVDAIKSIEMHDRAIRENVLAGFLDSSNTTKEEDQVLFLKATRFIADIICDTFNLYLIPQLMEFNFERVGTPRLRARRIGEQADWRTLSFAIRNLVGAGIIRPDDRLEEWIREEMDLPKADVKTMRVVQTPQGAPMQPGQVPNATPGTATPDPLQPGAQPTAGQKKQDTNSNTVGLPRQSSLPPVGLPSTGAGRDASGGK